MTLSLGTKVVYPSQGPCLVEGIVEKVIDGRGVRFYHLVDLGDSGAEVLVPVEKAKDVGLRRLLKRSDIPKLLAHLRKPVATSKDWKQRTQNNLERMTSGSAFRVAKVVKSLSDLSKTRKLSPPEARTLDRARSLLVSEIVQVMRVTKGTAEARIDEALESGKKA